MELEDRWKSFYLLQKVPRRRSSRFDEERRRNLRKKIFDFNQCLIRSKYYFFKEFFL
jgi:hypothetical protein